MSENIKQKFINPCCLEKLEKLFFSLFLLSIPLQTRLAFPAGETYLFGTFNEYATFFIYLSDIFLITTLLIYFVKLVLLSPVLYSIKNIKEYFIKYFQKDRSGKSVYFKDNLTKLSKISIIRHRLYTSPQLIPIILLFAFVFWSFLSIAWADYQNITLYKSLKLIELSLLFIYVYKRFYWFGIRRLLACVFVAGFIQAVIGVLQYTYQHSLGLKLLGESLLSSSIDNVAKIFIDGERVIRAYGTFPHPNIFGSFLILSIFSGIWLLLFDKRLKKNQIVSRLPFKASIQAMSTSKLPEQIVSRETILARAAEGETIFMETFLIKLFHVKQFKKYLIYIWLGFLTVGIILQFYVIILTFSRVAWFGLALSVVFFIAQILKLFHVKQLQINFLCKGQKISIIFIILSVFLMTGMFCSKIVSRSFDSQQQYQQSADVRVLYSKIAVNIIERNPLLGIGAGNFTLVMGKYTEKSLEWWQYQPVHNIYILIAGELGIVGLVIFMFFVLSIIYGLYYKQNNKIVSRETILNMAAEGETILYQQLFLSMVLSFLFMGLFDHYFWSFQQSQLTLWLVLGVLFGVRSKEN